jgi:hypothetical protein
MHADLGGPGKDRVFFWNVHGAVGLKGENRMDDVLFVSWCLYKMRAWAHLPEAAKAVLRSAPITSECSGREDDPLVVAIKAIQRLNPAMLVDGRVSPAVNAATGTYRHQGRNTLFLIFGLNNALKDLHPQHYPRIDLMPEFAWRLKQQAIAPFS